METFTTPEGLTLSYERRGSGPLLVCHPGGPRGSPAEFRDFAGLDDTFELVLLSPRGSQGSDAADDYALTSYVADLEGLREHLALDQLDLLGFSHGGIVAMAYAAAHGERIRRLVLAATLAVRSDEAEAAMHRTMEKRRDEPAADFAKAEPLHYFNTVEFPTFDLRPELRTITAPTLVLAGDDDLVA